MYAYNLSVIDCYMKEQHSNRSPYSMCFQLTNIDHAHFCIHVPMAPIGEAVWRTVYDESSNQQQQPQPSSNNHTLCTEMVNIGNQMVSNLSINNILNLSMNMLIYVTRN